MSIANRNTQGPWQAVPHDCCPGDWYWVAGSPGLGKTDVHLPKDNALQIAAAPDLLTALELLQGSNGCFGGCYGVSDWRHSGDCATARAAIAKARGQNVA